MSDPSSRSTRGLIGTALQHGNPELAEEYRQVLRVENVERAIHRQLDGAPPLTAAQLLQLRRTLEQYGPRRSAVTG